jgi:hypothetical protein
MLTSMSASTACSEADQVDVLAGEAIYVFDQPDA